jgi:pilus assembly protein CpaB
MKRILAVLAAVLLAGLGAVAVLGYAGAADARAVAGQEARTVYVSAQPVPAGTSLGDAVAEGLLTKDVFAAKAVPAGALEKVGPENEQLVATSDVAVGEIVLASRFGAQQEADTALVVPEGMVAITVELTDAGRVGPFLRPGSRIAVFDTYESRDPQNEDLRPGGRAGQLGDDQAADVNGTRVVLTDAEVLAVGDVTIDGRAPEAGADGSEEDAVTGVPAEEVPTTLVTVAVTPEDGQRLVHAAQTGHLYAGLLGEGAVGGDGLVEDRTLFAGKQ